MAALTATTPANAGTVVAGAPVASADTISTNVMGPLGCYLEIINGNASPDNVTIQDAGRTPAGNALTGGTIAATVTNGTSKVFHIKPSQAETTFNTVAVTHSVTATVTYKLYPVG